MKRILPVILAVLAGCVSEPSPRGGEDGVREPTPAEREVTENVREAVRKLVIALIDGDAMTTLSMMSVQGISDWVLERARDGSDGDFPTLVKTIDASRRVDFDHWVRSNKDVDFVQTRSIPLPESILTSKWLVETWKKYVAQEKDNQAIIAKEIEFGEIWVEGAGASVSVKLNETFAMMYSMKLEAGQWKYDYNVRSATARR